MASLFLFSTESLNEKSLRFTQAHKLIFLLFSRTNADIALNKSLCFVAPLYIPPHLCFTLHLYKTFREVTPFSSEFLDVTLFFKFEKILQAVLFPKITSTLCQIKCANSVFIFIITYFLPVNSMDGGKRFERYIGTIQYLLRVRKDRK